MSTFRRLVTSNYKNFIVLALTILAVGMPVLAVTLLRGADADVLGEALRFTARIAFFAYLLIFVARPLQQLGGPAVLRTNRRFLGIAFAAVMTVHLGFIVWLHGFVIDVEIPLLILGAGGFAYALTYSMLITSFDRTTAMLGPRNWRRLHKAGLYWIGIVFAYTLAAAQEIGPVRMTLAGLFAGTLVLRVIAFVRRESKHGSDGPGDV